METFENPHPDLLYEIQMDCTEFTCLCPITGQPDHATFQVIYVPDRTCVELKSFKQYLWSFRDQGLFHEDVTNRIMKALRDLLDPHYLEVVGDFNIRGGIQTQVRSIYTRDEADE